MRTAQGAIDDKKVEIAELRTPSDETEDATERPVIEAAAADETTTDDAPVEEEGPST